MSWVPSPTKKNDDKQAKIYARIRHQRKEQRVKKGSGPQRGYQVLQNSLRRDSSASSLLGMLKLKSRPE